jgi:nucleolar protein 56
MIFQHPDVHRAPYWQRGNISRALAGKALIAAKVDNYRGEFIGDTLLKEFNEKVDAIRKRYPGPPKRTESKQKGAPGKNKGKHRR